MSHNKTHREQLGKIILLLILQGSLSPLELFLDWQVIPIREQIHSLELLLVSQPPLEQQVETMARGDHVHFCGASVTTLPEVEVFTYSSLCYYYYLAELL